MKVELLPPDSLTPYANNAKKHPTEQIDKIAGQIAKFGFDQPIVVDKQKVIIKGHGRREAALRLGLKEVPVVIAAHLSDHEAMAVRLADNRVAESDWDDKFLKFEFGTLDRNDFDLNLTGFDQDEWIDFLKDDEEVDGGSRDTAAGEASSNPITKKGDIIYLGKHRLLCGDATDQADVTKLIGDANIDLCFTSPPYDDQRDYGGDKNIDPIHLTSFIDRAKARVKHFCVNLGYSRKNNEVNQYWDHYIAAARSAGLKLLSWNVWNKGYCGSVGNQTAMFGISHEWIFVFGREPIQLEKTVPNKYAGEISDHNWTRRTDGKTEKQKTRVIADKSQLKTVIELGPEKGKDGKEHPARFPIALPSSYAEAFGAKSLYEPFCGSGSTLIACENLGISCYAMELDPSYCDLIVDRWERHSGLTANRGSNQIATSSQPATSV